MDIDLRKLEEFDDHRLVEFVYDAVSGLEAFIAIHRGGLSTPSFGATRFWHYEKKIDALQDALRLARLMSYKSALAGLPYGGAKAVIYAPAQITHAKKKKILQAYAKGVNYLHGSFVTGTDVGMSMDDLRVMRKESAHMVGTKTNPEKYTGMGIFYALRATFKEIQGSPEIAGRTFAIQGLGKVGEELLKYIYKDAATIFVADIDNERLKRIQKMYPRVFAVGTAEIHRQKVDIFSPCALAGAINPRSVNELQCAAVVGGANNQLSTQEMGDRLFQKDILYAPDYVANGGGLISVADEFEHEKPSHERIEKRVHHIEKIMGDIFSQSRKKKLAPHRIANDMAEKIFNKRI